MRAIIGGTSLIDSSVFQGWHDLSLDTPYGPVTIKENDAHIFLQRHEEPPVPPHRINHRAHIWALRELKVNEIVAVNSVGSLKAERGPGTLVIPHDFMSFSDVPTFFDEEMRFIVPEMDGPLRERLAGLCRDLTMDVAPGGVYIQTRGPRLETRAEIAFLRNFGDVVGMTMASEATLSMELGIPYVSLCSIDNYCNGILSIPLTMEEIKENALKNLKRIESLIQRFLSKGLE